MGEAQFLSLGVLFGTIADFSPLFLFLDDQHVVLVNMCVINGMCLSFCLFMSCTEPIYLV